MVKCRQILLQAQRLQPLGNAIKLLHALTLLEPFNCFLHFHTVLHKNYSNTQAFIMGQAKLQECTVGVMGSSRMRLWLELVQSTVQSLLPGMCDFVQSSINVFHRYSTEDQR